MIRPLLLMMALWSGPACAGPPFLTDDPVPTDTGHWEIYAPFAATSGGGGSYTGGVGAELNYGALPGVQLTLDLPVSYADTASRWRFGRGDVQLAAKYRFYFDKAAGLSIAFFPGLTIPTAGRGFGAGRVTGFLPIWIEKDRGAWSAFGGGGLAINPGPGNRDYWTGGVALARQINEGLLVGVEADRQGADTVGGPGTTSLGVGAILALRPPFRLLASGGPVFTDHQARPGLHGFVALGINL